MSDVWDLKTGTQSLNATWHVINDYNQSLFPRGLRQFISWRSTLLYMCVSEFSLQLLLLWWELISRCHFDGTWWCSNSATWEERQWHRWDMLMLEYGMYCDMKRILSSHFFTISLWLTLNEWFHSPVSLRGLSAANMDTEIVMSTVLRAILFLLPWHYLSFLCSCHVAKCEESVSWSDDVWMLTERRHWGLYCNVTSQWRPPFRSIGALESLFILGVMVFGLCLVINCYIICY